MSKNYYEILGVSHMATQAEIKGAFRTLAKKYHPDVSSDPNATEIMQKITEAYEVLSDLELRRKYDIKLGYNNTTKSSQNTEQYSYYQSYTYTKEESEFDFEDWLRAYLRRSRKNFENTGLGNDLFMMNNFIMDNIMLLYMLKKNKNTKNKDENSNSHENEKENTLKKIK